MKRVLIFMFLLLMPLVSAGESVDVDFTFELTHALLLGEGDEIRFDMYGDRHAIYVEDISTSSVKFRLVPFLNEDTQTYPAFVSLDTIAKLDLQKDGVDDLNVALYSVDEDGKATMVFQKAVGNSATGNSGVIDNVESSSKNIYLIVIGVVVVILILVLLFVNLGKEEVKEEVKPEE